MEDEAEDSYWCYNYFSRCNPDYFEKVKMKELKNNRVEMAGDMTRISARKDDILIQHTELGDEYYNTIASIKTFLVPYQSSLRIELENKNFNLLNFILKLPIKRDKDKLISLVTKMDKQVMELEKLELSFESERKRLATLEAIDVHILNNILALEKGQDIEHISKWIGALNSVEMTRAKDTFQANYSVIQKTMNKSEKTIADMLTNSKHTFFSTVDTQNSNDRVRSALLDDTRLSNHPTIILPTHPNHYPEARSEARVETDRVPILAQSQKNNF